MREYGRRVVETFDEKDWGKSNSLILGIIKLETGEIDEIELTWEVILLFHTGYTTV